VQARRSPREDGMETVEEAFEPPRFGYGPSTTYSRASRHVMGPVSCPEQEALQEGAQAPSGGELGAVAVRICPRREALNRGRFPRGIYPKRRGISR
jgi:hypothetical protein